jgi:hypothetical protein
MIKATPTITKKRMQKNTAAEKTLISKAQTTMQKFRVTAINGATKKAPILIENVL